METDRRTLLALAAGALATPALGASTPKRPVARSVGGSAGGSVGMGEEVLPLWPGTPPGGNATTAALVEQAADQSHDPAHPDRFITHVAQPRLIVHRPANPNGAAVLLFPGGGYEFLSYDNEGVSQARWLNAMGVTAFILVYRLPGEGWSRRQDVPLQDAQRAVRLVRANAAKYGVLPNRLAVIGFSAGGHLAGSLATRHSENVYAPVDAADTLSARPDLAGMLYPVVTLSEAFTHVGSREALLGKDSSEEQRRRYSVDQSVDAQTSPSFLVHAGDDGLVPPANSLSLYAALQAQGHPAELHVFAKGGHGFGVRPPTTMPVSAWPRLFAAFAASLHDPSAA